MIATAQLPRPVAPLVAVSDAHLGIGDAADNATDPGALYEFFANIAANWRIVLVGDIMDIWESPLRAIVAWRRNLLRLIAERRMTYIYGNHDDALSLWEPAGFCWAAWSSGPVYAEHGNSVDRHNRKGTITGRLVTVASGAAERLGLRPANTLARFLKSRFAKSSGLAQWAGETPTPYLRRAADVLSIPECDLYLWGHTHSRGVWYGEEIAQAIFSDTPQKTSGEGEQAIVERERLQRLLLGKLAVNTGCWIDGRTDITVAAGRTVAQGSLRDWQELQDVAAGALSVAVTDSLAAEGPGNGAT